MSALPNGDATPEFNLPSAVPIDAVNTLEQLTRSLRSVRDGLPELVKNAKDQYARLGVHDRSERQVVVAASTDRRMLAVIDFAGAPKSNFQGWTTWSNPRAGQADLAPDIEAGHGNGGKAFMVQGATSRAFLDSCYEGRRTCMGFVNDRPGDRFKPGYRNVGGQVLDDVAESDPEARLDEVLRDLGTRVVDLPEAAKVALRARRAYTVVVLDRVVDWEGRRKALGKLAAQQIVDAISDHGQTALSVETCEVWAMVDGKVIGDGPVTPTPIPPFPGFEETREHAIPDVLPDPQTGEAVVVAGPGLLSLKTSARQLQMSDETRARNVIRVWNVRNNVATWPLTAILEAGAAASFIHGELRCPALTSEHLAGADRMHLSDTPLVRALHAWTGAKVRELAQELHKSMAERTNPKERERARSALHDLRNLMRRFLDPDATGARNPSEGAGDATGEQDGIRRKRPSPIYGKRLDRIVLEGGATDLAVVVGARVPLRFSALEVDADGVERPIRDPGVALVSEVPGQFTLDAEGRLTALAPGVGAIVLISTDGGVTSNRVEVWSGAARGVTVEPPAEPLKQGERRLLRVTFETDEGPLDEALLDAEVLEPEMGSIGRHGQFTAGWREGTATVRIRFGAAPEDIHDVAIAIGAEAVPPPQGKGATGTDLPLILLCGDAAPGTQELPDEQRTIAGGEHYPTIYEEPKFPNIVWINPTSKEAVRVRGSRGGPTGMGKITSKTFLNFIALKCFEILKRLHVRQQIGEDSVTENQFVTMSFEAEVACADFIDAAWELSEELVGKEG